MGNNGNEALDIAPISEKETLRYPTGPRSFVEEELRTNERGLGALATGAKLFAARYKDDPSMRGLAEFAGRVGEALEPLRNISLKLANLVGYYRLSIQLEPELKPAVAAAGGLGMLGLVVAGCTTNEPGIAIVEEIGSDGITDVGETNGGTEVAATDDLIALATAEPTAPVEASPTIPATATPEYVPTAEAAPAANEAVVAMQEQATFPADAGGGGIPDGFTIFSDMVTGYLGGEGLGWQPNIQFRENGRVSPDSRWHLFVPDQAGAYYWSFGTDTEGNITFAHREPWAYVLNQDGFYERVDDGGRVIQTIPGSEGAQPGFMGANDEHPTVYKHGAIQAVDGGAEVIVYHAYYQTGFDNGWRWVEGFGVGQFAIVGGQLMEMDPYDGTLTSVVPGFEVAEGARLVETDGVMQLLASDGSVLLEQDAQGNWVEVATATAEVVAATAIDRLAEAANVTIANFAGAPANPNGNPVPIWVDGPGDGDWGIEVTDVKAFEREVLDEWINNLIIPALTESTNATWENNEFQPYRDLYTGQSVDELRAAVVDKIIQEGFIRLPWLQWSNPNPQLLPNGSPPVDLTVVRIGLNVNIQVEGFQWDSNSSEVITPADLGMEEFDPRLIWNNNGSGVAVLLDSELYRIWFSYSAKASAHNAKLMLRNAIKYHSWATLRAVKGAGPNVLNGVSAGQYINQDVPIPDLSLETFNPVSDP